MKTVAWHAVTVEEALQALGTSASGLSSAEATSRLERFGPNELVERKKKTAFAMFLDQFADFMIIVLLSAAVVSGAIGEVSDAVAIIVIVLLNAILGFSQEYRAEQAMAALKKMAASRANVLRGGDHLTVAASELVNGDIVLLDAGNIVPADVRIIEAARLKAEEAALTGESVPVDKHAEAIPCDLLPLGDRKNMLYRGTFVSYGRATAVVTATGMQTELGRIASLLQEEGEGKTPLQKRLAVFGRKLALAVLVICAVIFVSGLLRGEPAVRIFLVAVSLAVAAIPEALPAVVTISLALGARKMVRRNALVRKLPSVETLGSVTYICSDKTGTLTVNRMVVEEMWVDGTTVRRSERQIRSSPSPQPSSLRGEGDSFFPHAELLTPHALFMTALALSNDARLDSSGKAIGDPTEVALFSVAQDYGFIKNRLEQGIPRVAELPFDSERKLMTTIHTDSRRPGDFPRYVSFTKGAFDVLIDRIDFVQAAEGLQRADKDDLIAVHDRMAAEGLRVIAVAMRTWDQIPDAPSHQEIEKGLTLLGLAGMMDPPREEARQAVFECKRAGITPVMITGDHPLTARAVALRAGILESDDPKAVITGLELNALSLASFEKRVEHVRVYARVAPEQKLKIVKALQERGHFIAMTGDGVNDAPALKAADIGVAMGITGTDVAKEASSMILLDDNFATIVRAVREGRTIYDNIRKFVKYLLSTNSGEIWTLFLAPFFGLPIPLLPIQILWINLLTDGLPALALSLEPEEGDVMNRPPRHPKESIFAHGLGIHAVWVGLLMGAVTLSLQAWAIRSGVVHWQTMVFTVLCLLQLGHVMAIRSERESLFTQGIFRNKSVLLSVTLMILLQLATIYLPFFNPVFTTQPLSVTELALVLLLSSVVFFAVEIEKLVKRAPKNSLTRTE